MKQEYVQLPSGKKIIRQFADDGSLIEEHHIYGGLDIGIQFSFRAGTKIQETYFSKGRLVSRKSYEKTRTRYEDMPIADGAFQDWGGTLVREVAQERRRRAVHEKRHIPNPKDARESDSFCTKVMKRRKRGKAIEWIQSKNHTLGERNWSSSRRLVDELSSLGCLNIYACQIDSYEDGGENTGHLVVELPKTGLERRKIFKKIHRLATEQGYSGPLIMGNDTRT